MSSQQNDGTGFNWDRAAQLAKGAVGAVGKAITMPTQQGSVPSALAPPPSSIFQIPQPQIQMPGQVDEAQALAGAPPAVQQQTAGTIGLDMKAMFGDGYGAYGARVKEANADLDSYSKAQAQAQALLSRGQAGEAQAVAGQAEVDKNAAADLAPSFQAHEETIAKINEDQQVALQSAQQMTQAAQQKYNAAVDDLNNSDFHSFWADKSTGARAIGIIAALLGGAANGFAGNPGAPTPLDRVIDRDFQLQMAEMQKKERAVGVARGKLQDIREQTGSDMAAFAVMRVAANNKLTAIAQEMANRIGGQKAPLIAQQVAAQFQQKNAMIMQSVTQAKYSASVQHMNTLLNIDGRKQDAAKQQIEMAFALQKARGGGENQITELQGQPLKGQSLDQLRNGITAYKQLGEQFSAIAGSNNPIRNSQSRSAAATALGTLEARGPRFSQAQRQGAEAQIGGLFTGSDAHNQDIMRQKGRDLYMQMRAQGNEPVPGSDIDQLFKQYGVYGSK